MKRIAFLVPAVLSAILVLAAVARGAEDAKPLSDEKAKASYSIGYEFGKNLKTWEMDMDMDVLFVAIREGMEGRKPTMTGEEMRETMKQIRRDAVVRLNWRKGLESGKNKTGGEKFLTENKANEGVRTLPSGLQYMVLAEGNGPRPQVSDTVMVNYRGTLLNGTEFDSSNKRGAPEKIRVNGVIKGWTAVLPLMQAGSKWRIFVPPELGYGDRQFGRIPPNSTLIFELELVSIVKGDDVSRKQLESANKSTNVPATDTDNRSTLEKP